MNTPTTPSPRDRDGVRMLDASDRARIIAHLTGLCLEDRINRFCCVTTDELIEQYVDRIRHGHDIVLGTLVGGRLVGLVHAAVFEDGRERVCEIGISVDSALRKTGIGKRMLRASIDSAKAIEIRKVVVQFMTSNRAMAALARSAGGRLERDGSESSAVFQAVREPAGVPKTIGPEVCPALVASAPVKRADPPTRTTTLERALGWLRLTWANPCVSAP